jgi:cell division protein FtsN
MARDYKNRIPNRRKRRAPPPWVWTLAGLLVGLFIAFLVFLQMSEPAREDAASVPLAMPAPAEPTTPTPAPAPVVKARPAEPPPKPRFDFYDLLPEIEVIVPEQELKGEPTQEGVKPVEQPGTYLLQAGSFRKQEQAEQLRARLGLLGYETSIQTVSIDNRQSWHRVRVGPFHNLSELNEARSQLKKNGVDAILIRLKN